MAEQGKPSAELRQSCRIRAEHALRCPTPQAIIGDSYETLHYRAVKKLAEAYLDIEWIVRRQDGNE